MAVRLPFRLPQLGPRMRRVLRYVGFVVLALVTFVFALQATFPYHRVKDKLVEVLSAKYDVSIKEVERGIMPGRVYFKSVFIKTRQLKPEDPITVFTIDSLEVDLGVLALIGQTASIDIEAVIGSGTISGNISVSKSGYEIHVEGSSLPSKRLPMREALSNLPMDGRIGFDLDLDLPNEKLKNGKIGPNWSKAEGGLSFRCPSGCTIGDGKSKLKLKAKNSRSQAFAGDGTDFGTIKVDSIFAKVDVKNGMMKLSKFELKSPDVELHVELELKLAQNIDQSDTTGCLRFKGTEALREREPKTFDQISLTGAVRGADGLDQIKLDGTFKDMKKLAVLCGPGQAAGKSGGDDTPARPNLTIQPDQPLKDNPPTTATFNPPPPTGGEGFRMPVDAGAASPDAGVTVPVPGPDGEHNGGSAGSGSGSAAVDPTGAPVPAGSGEPQIR